MSDLSDNFETLQDMKKENRKLQSKVRMTLRSTTRDYARINMNWRG